MAALKIFDTVIDKIKAASTFEKRLEVKQAGRPTPPIHFEGKRQCRYVKYIKEIMI